MMRFQLGRASSTASGSDGNAKRPEGELQRNKRCGSGYIASQPRTHLASWKTTKLKLVGPVGTTCTVHIVSWKVGIFHHGPSHLQSELRTDEKLRIDDSVKIK